MKTRRNRVAREQQRDATFATSPTSPSRYTPLPKELRIGGFNLRQRTREGDLAVYEQSHPKCPTRLRYEVIVIRRREAFEIKGRRVEAAEFYPRSEDWGSFGWTLTTRDAALEKLQQVRSENRGVRFGDESPRRTNRKTPNLPQPSASHLQSRGNRKVPAGG